MSRAYLADAIRQLQQRSNVYAVFAGDRHRSREQRDELMDRHNTMLAELAQLRTFYTYLFGYEVKGA
jgi:hypothetical protein